MSDGNAEIGSMLDEIRPAYKILKKLGVFEKVQDWIARKDPCYVLVLGASGTGKSSFLNVIYGKEPSIRRWDRTEDVKNISGKIEGSYFLFTDTPGEDLHEARRKFKGIQSAMGRNHIGIINVVSYGHHEGKKPINEIATEAGISSDYLNVRRKKEIDLLKEWAPLLCGRGGVCDWVLTLVTKADLWWTEQKHQEILSHYDSGFYYETLKSHIDEIETPHLVRPYSSINQLFYDKFPMSGCYSDKMRSDDHEALIALLLEKAS